MNNQISWVVTDGKAGMLAQAIGLAEAIGVPIINKTVSTSRFWRCLPQSIWPHSLFGGVTGASKTSDPILQPWPSLLISCGRSAVGPALAVKRRSGGNTFIVHVQHPRVNPNRFDIVVVPEHDGLTGPNVMVTLGALNRATPQRLRESARQIASKVSHLPRPLVAVLIGGSNHSYRLTEGTINNLMERLKTLSQEHGIGLMVTPSRRTGSEINAILRKNLGNLPAVLWNQVGQNPYFGFLGLADAIIVTPDSVNMVSEACSTGKPVYIAPMEGGNAKFSRFHRSLAEEGITRPFLGTIDTWQYSALDETSRVAAAIREHLEQHHTLPNTNN